MVGAVRRAAETLRKGRAAPALGGAHLNHPAPGGICEEADQVGARAVLDRGRGGNRRPPQECLAGRRTGYRHQ